MSRADDSTITPSDLQIRSGLAYLDDSVVALRQLRKAAAPKGALVECFTDPDALLARALVEPALVAVLLDVDLGDGVDGPMVATRLRERAPSVAIAFFTAERSAERATTLAHLGPVFDKSTDLDAVVRWFAEYALQA